jgi:hypothetical protein
MHARRIASGCGITRRGALRCHVRRCYRECSVCGEVRYACDAAARVIGAGARLVDGFASNNCTGNDGQISGTFVDADVSLKAISCNNGAPAMCVYNPDSSIQFERLIE